MNRKALGFIVLVLVLLLSSCGGNQSLYNFSPREDSTLITTNKLIMVEYKTNTEGKLIELNIDRLLTIEEMILMNPIIDFEYEMEGFTGDIFIKPQNSCTDISNDILVPINIEVGNTRYKYDSDDCKYKTVDNYNEFRPGYADEYFLTDTIPVARHITISIIVYNPSELISFVEIYTLPNTYEKLGVYNILINRDRDGFEYNLVNYYRDMAVFEQLYLKHQELEAAVQEVSGIATDINLMDLDSLTEINPLIDNFEAIYEEEIKAIEELQEEIGVAFETSAEEIVDEEETEE